MTEESTQPTGKVYPPLQKDWVQVRLCPIDGLDNEIRLFEERTGEYGAVDEEFHAKRSRTKPPVCFGIIPRFDELDNMLKKAYEEYYTAQDSVGLETIHEDALKALDNAFEKRAEAARRHVDAKLAEAKANDPAIAMQYELSQAFRRFDNSGLARENWLGAMGVYGNNECFYVPDKQIIETLRASNVITDETKNRLQELLTGEFTVEKLDKAVEYGLMDTKDAGKLKIRMQKGRELNAG